VQDASAYNAPRRCAVYFADCLNLRLKQIQALIECEFRISGHTQKSEGFETIREKLTTWSISTECVKAVVADLWPVWIFVAPRCHK